MHRSPRRPYRYVIPMVCIVVASAASAARLIAQDATPSPVVDVGPAKGAWGGEVSVGDYITSIMRMSSPRAAWLLTGGASAVRSKNSQYPEPDYYYTFDVRLGRRWWRVPSPDRRTRPWIGVGLGYGYAGDAGPDFHSRGVLGYGELGLSYFFSPHIALSAGMSADVSYVRYHQGDPGSGANSMDRWYWRASSNFARVRAAVFF